MFIFGVAFDSILDDRKPLSQRTWLRKSQFFFPDLDDLFVELIQEQHPGDAQTYNEIITHECLRVAVCEMLENPRSTPQQLR